MLGGDFCDRFAEVINPRQILLELEDVTQVPIVIRSSNRYANSVPLPEIIQDLPHEGRISHMVRVSKSVILEPQIQTVFTITTSRIGLMEIQTLQALYVPLKMLLANYAKKRCWIQKNKTVSHLLPQPSEVISTTVNLAEVMGVRYQTYRDLYQKETQEVFTTVNEEDFKFPHHSTNSKQEDFDYHKNESKKEPLSDLYMEHQTYYYLSRLLTVLRNYLGL